MFLCLDDKNFKMKATTSKIFMFWCYPFQNKIFSSDFLFNIKFGPQKILVCFERNEGLNFEMKTLKSGRWVKSKKSLNHQSPVVEFSELPSFLTWLIWRAQTQKEQKIDTVQSNIFSLDAIRGKNPQKYKLYNMTGFSKEKTLVYLYSI